MRTYRNKISTMLLAVSAVLAAGVASADEGFDVKVSPGHIVVTPKTGWHINLAYPWKLTVGDTKLDKSKFQLSETSASVEAPKGTGKLKGAVCEGDKQCKMFEQAVSVP